MSTMRIVPTQFVRYWVPALNELKNRSTRFGRRMNCAAVQQLTFQCGEETLAQRVVETVTDGTHGWAHVGIATTLPEGERGILTPLIRVVDDFRGASLSERHAQRVHDELCTQMGFHGPADTDAVCIPTQFARYWAALCHTAAPGIDDDGEVQRAGPRREIGDVRHPKAVRPSRGEVTLDQVWRGTRRRLPNSGAQSSKGTALGGDAPSHGQTGRGAAADAPQARRKHQARHALASCSDALVAQLGTLVAPDRVVMDARPLHTYHASACTRLGYVRSIVRPRASVARVHVSATRRSRWWRPPAGDTLWPQDSVPGSPSRPRRPGGDRVGLPCEPGRCFCQDLSLKTELLILTPQAHQFLSLSGCGAVVALAGIDLGLLNPIADRLLGGFELACKFNRAPASER